MKIKNLILLSSILITTLSFAQKDELKALKKIYNKDVPSATDLQDYKTNLSKLEAVAVEEGDKTYLNFYKCILPQLEIASSGKVPTPDQFQKLLTPKAISDLVAGYNATLEYEKKSGKKVFTDDINEDITAMKPVFLTIAIEYGKVKKYNEAASILYSIYLLDKKDQEKLFYAASYAVNGQDYDKALEYYQELKKVNYSGEGTAFYAVNKANKQEESFPTKDQRDLFVKAETHEKPRDEKIPSKRGEIYKNIALILMEKGKTEEAKTAFAEARKANPDDTSLIYSEADLYLKINDYTTYTKVVNEALERNPNSVDLIFNLGVISDKANKLDEAEKYYKRAIEINPEYFNAYLNLAEIKLRGDQKFVDEMNKLGTSEKDNKRYEVIKGERNKNFLSILPLLEKAVQLDSANEPAKKTLLSVYNALEMTDKYKALKAKM